MNILFLTLLDFNSIDERSIYTDLLREFYKNGHSVYAISPVERRKKQNTKILRTEKATILKLRIGNIQKTHFIEKGISTVNIEPQFIAGIKKYFSDVKFDFVIYSTPPITFFKAIEFVKRRDNAKTYLLLKDIFPQNAVDMGMMSKKGIKGILYANFRKKEKKLYQVSDYIGCMSLANVKYVIKHNPEVDEAKVELSPNSIIIRDMSIRLEKRNNLRVKYGIPLDKKVFVYGGNLGKPQGIDFLVECLRKTKFENALFLIIGDGTDQYKIQEYVENERPQNVILMKRLPKEDYDLLVSSCDIGLIFLDHRFTIPNFPSRLLSYMQSKIPTLAVTDTASDIGKVIEEGQFGWWCESNDSDAFVSKVRSALDSDVNQLGKNGFEYLKSHYDVEDSVRGILTHIKNE